MNMNIIEISIILSIIILVFVCVILYVPKESIINNITYIQLLTLCIFTITCALGILNLKYSIEDRKKMSATNYSNLSQIKIHEIDKIFLSNRLLDNLYFEMYQNDPNIMKIVELKNNSSSTNLYNDSNNDNNSDSDTLVAEHHASSLIFQTICDIYTCELKDKYINGNIFVVQCNDNEWIKTFSGWMKSKILKKHWNYLKREYNKDVQDFINLMINFLEKSHI